MIKSLVRPAAFTACLTLLTCWLFVKSRQNGHEEYDNLGQLLSFISRVDAKINAEVLKLEFHLNKNYDHLTLLEKRYAESCEELNQYRPFAFGNDEKVHQQLTRPLKRKLELVTDFKALHSVLENSVAIFNRASRQLRLRLKERAEPGAVTEELLHLERAAMELVLHASPNSLQEVEHGVAWLQSIDLSTDAMANRSRNLTLAHARNLADAKPKMDRLMLEMEQLNVPVSIQAIHANATQLFAITRAKASQYQLQLLCATLLLTGYCGYSINRISKYVTTIQQANERLEERVRVRTRDLEAKTEVLRSNGRFLSSVLDAMDAKICILDADGTISATNAAWREAAGSDTVRSGENYLQAFQQNVRTIFGAQEVVAAIDGLRSSQANTAVVEFATNGMADRKCVQARVSKMMPQGLDKFLGYVVALIDITERVEAQEQQDKLNRQLQAMSRQAGMAEVATGVLHNVGNVLNSINIASSQAARIVKTSRLVSLQRADALVEQHLDDFAAFVAEDPRGRQIPKYISQIAKTWEEEQSQVLNELAELTKHIEHVKHVINIQQEHAKVAKVTQAFNLASLLDDALATVVPTLKAANIELKREVKPLPTLHSDPHKIMQIVVNLLSNAKHAVMDAGPLEPRIILRAEQTSNDEFLVSVVDNGIGIAPENMARICQHGFTTKKNGHGFGLHSCSLLAKELGGELEFASPGVHCGATFSLRLPIQQTTTNIDREPATVAG